jgi:phenylacetate-CoA ligase
MTDFYDALEHRDPAARSRPAGGPARPHRPRAAGHQRLCREPGRRGRGGHHQPRRAGAIAGLRKSELLERQKALRAQDPFGGFAAIGWRGLRAGAARAACSSRPARSTNPRAGRRLLALARAIFAAGFRAGDLVHNSFSYHLTPGASIMESGAHAVGCTTFPGGVGNTELQLQAMAELRRGLRRHAQLPAHPAGEGAETGVALRSLKKAWSAARPFPPSPARLAGRARHGRPTSAMPPPTSA